VAALVPLTTAYRMALLPPFAEIALDAPG